HASRPRSPVPRAVTHYSIRTPPATRSPTPPPAQHTSPRSCRLIARSFTSTRDKFLTSLQKHQAVQRRCAAQTLGRVWEFLRHCRTDRIVTLQKHPCRDPTHHY